MRVVFSGGGTGGHIYPALALADIIRQHDRDSHMLYIGSQRGVESTIVPKTGMPFEALTVQGFRRSLSLDNIKTLWRFMKAVRQAKRLLRGFKPDVVVGTGGYVSGAVVYAAQQLRIPTVIHEQNSVAGITNKFLARRATKIGIAFEAARRQFPKRDVTFVGNPRAQQVAELHSQFSWQTYGLNPERPTLLIFGGSQGAPAINQAAFGALIHFNQQDYQVVLVTGPKRYQAFRDQLDSSDTNIADNIRILPYIDNMPEVLVKTAAIVSRAGATSIAEITALGLPSILVPSRHVTGDHQTKNAESLVQQGAATLIVEDQLTSANLIMAVDAILQVPSTRTAMSEKARAVGVPDAGDRLYQLLCDATADRSV